jgi:TrmH family RNA methyltransferase
MTGDVRYDHANWSAWALIIGSEAHGASPVAEQIAAHRVYIPMASGAESLNAAVAAGILLFEAFKQSNH